MLIKGKVVKILEENKGKNISGEELLKNLIFRELPYGKQLMHLEVKAIQ